MRTGHYCDFTWDKQAFPNPEEMLANLKSKGFKLSLWEHPYVSINSEMYKEGLELGYFANRDKNFSTLLVPGLPEDVGGLPNGLVDFSNPQAVKWFKEKHKFLIESGVCVFMTDFGEAVPVDSKFHNGMTGTEMHNLYALLYHKAVSEAFEEFINKKGLILSRDGWAGSQRYPACWSGDSESNFETMACVMRGGLSYALSGVPFWTHDIGGFSGTPTAELYVRWAQFGVFSPLTRTHGNHSPREPWVYGEDAEKIFRQYMKLRYRIIALHLLLCTYS
jgi:alpha-D-xyloside xylohydrolase